jgi:ankyrin repeat protein
LHYAAHFGNLYAAQRLEITFGTHIDWNAENEKGWTALDEAASREFMDIAELSLLEKVKFEQRSSNMITYLEMKGVNRKRQ